MKRISLSLYFYLYLGEQPRLAIIFRGQGKRINPDEKLACHPDVDDYWQQNAWADTEVSLKFQNQFRDSFRVVFRQLD